MLGLDLALRFLLLLAALQRLHLRFGQDEMLFGSFLFQSSQAFLERLQAMPQPDRTHPARRHEQTAFLQFIGHPHLSIGGIVGGVGHHRFLNRRVYSVLGVGLLSADLLKSSFTIGFIQFSEAEEAVALISRRGAPLAALRAVKS